MPVFDHSWRLTPAIVQSILRQLSVFRGGFTRGGGGGGCRRGRWVTLKTWSTSRGCGCSGYWS